MSAQATPGSGRIITLVAVVGISTLGSEIAAARLLAPWFGASTIIWANTIATVLVALSIGYWLGGRYADRDPTMHGLCRIVLIAAVGLAIVPFVATPFLRVSVDALDSIEAGAFVGSLIAVLVLVATPLILLGMVAPYAIRLSVTTAEEAGRVSGRLYAISTLGSLAGVFSAALLLIPLLGTRRTFLVYALMLAMVALLGLGRRAVVVAGAVGAAIALPVGSVKAADEGRTLLDEAETEYGYARIVEDREGDRLLELNEGQAVHSILRESGDELTGLFWDDYLVLPFALERARSPRSVAIVGNAGGTMARAFGRFFPEAEVDGVEIDGEITEMGKRWLGLRERPGYRLHTDDARPWLERTDRRFDLITLDAYRQPYIPFYLATKEFFELTRDRLEPGGAVIVNVGHPESSDALEQTLTRTLREVFPTVLRDPAQPTNTLLLATDQRASGEQLARRALDLPSGLAPVATTAAARLAPGLEGGSVWTDDKAPVEWLIDTSIVKVAADGSRTGG